MKKPMNFASNALQKPQYHFMSVVCEKMDITTTLMISRIIMLQARLRGHLTRSRLDRTKVEKDHAATIIQKYWQFFRDKTDFL